ncbi:glycosyltransferase [Capillimicrobium parvum]|uniref:D-inositol-3-phosphate glycosyltransferase n=1 Tax=Capillimicrobium parvum TaxID=2884022 RepID=A0A9E6XT31_9ACTN|nr:glycosyltransferase [Capillimicrobium parvum]UGS34031.1 D-inositol-3-phosphate glycosyltransferase [Capillimicrobium parvum]
MAVHSAGYGGAQLVAISQARALRREYDLVIAIGTGPLRAAFAEVAAAIVRGPPNLPIWGASRGRWTLQIGRAIPDAVRFAVLVRRHEIDVVVVNSTVLVAPVIGARMAGVPVVVHAQEAPKSAAARRLFRVHGVLAHTVVAISPWVAQAFDGAVARVMSNPVGIPIPPDPGPRELCAADPLRLVMVGTVDRHKGQHVAIAAVRALRDRGLEAELTLHGLEADQAYAAELREQARDLGVARQVHFAGPTSDVAACLLAADTLLLAAGEVTPLVLMEAMALRTPVVAARMGSIPDVVSDGVSGLLVAPDDPVALAAAVARLGHETGLAERIAEAGRRRVEEDFDETRGHRRLSAEIRRLTGRPDASHASGALVVVRRRLGAPWRRMQAALLRWRLRASSARVAGALVYHETFRTPPSAEQVVPGLTAAALERHLRHLRRSYQLVTPSQLHRAMLSRRRGGRIPVAVTFDDDLASHVEVAAPLLRSLGCPAAFFLTGAGLDGPHGFWWQRLQATADRGLDPRPALRTAGLRAGAEQSLADLAADVERSPSVHAAVAEALSQLVGEDPAEYHLTRSQVGQLAREGFEIGFHTRDHRPLPELADDDLEGALRDGRAALEEAAGCPLTTIAYPHGRADERVAAAARAAGYTDGFGGAGRSITARSDRLLLPRIELLLEDPGSFELAMACELWADR